MAKQKMGRRTRSVNNTVRDWYKTEAPSHTRCMAGCSMPIRKGAVIAYRHEPTETLCLECARRQGLLLRPARRYATSR
jgi:hypothetical protein